MINLVEIKKTKKNRYQLIISNNDTEEKHIVSENIIIKYNLLTPRELNKKEYNTITRIKIEDLLYEKALFFIDFKMRTISEVKKRLRKEVEDENIINKIIKRLKDNKYLDDNYYVKTYLHEKLEYDLIGPKNIKEKLILKGVHYDIIDQHLVSYKEKHQYDKVQHVILS